MSNYLNQKVKELKHLVIKVPNEKIQIEIHGGGLFNILEKNSGITEKFIYYNYNPTVDQIPIFNGSENIFGFVPKKSLIDDKKPLKISIGFPIIIVRKGNAGHIFYQNQFNESIIAEDAIAIEFKKEYKDKIDIYWFIREYKQNFRNAATGKFSSATFSNTSLKKMKFKIPSKSFQSECSELYKKVDDCIEKLQKYVEKIDFKIFQLQNTTITH